ncbi:hypothetical protein CRE_06297 [Caenorhabditis remanei]|uniref:Uncharacterized protein n=1 Tax=Caenorhabditis remanei TaxID=31234 RepID=E3M129_CAERE|nr:hypothetical protein CRE_06297 [Caenorhabditis remanei]
MQSLNLPMPEAVKGEHHAMKEFEKEWNRDSVKQNELISSTIGVSLQIMKLKSSINEILNSRARPSDSPSVISMEGPLFSPFVKTTDRFDTAIEEKIKKHMIQEILKETGKQSSLLDTFSQVESEVKELESSVMEAIMQTTITDPALLMEIIVSLSTQTPERKPVLLAPGPSSCGSLFLSAEPSGVQSQTSIQNSPVIPGMLSVIPDFSPSNSMGSSSGMSSAQASDAGYSSMGQISMGQDAVGFSRLPKARRQRAERPLLQAAGNRIPPAFPPTPDFQSITELSSYRNFRGKALKKLRNAAPVAPGTPEHKARMKQAMKNAKEAPCYTDRKLVTLTSLFDPTKEELPQEVHNPVSSLHLFRSYTALLGYDRDKSRELIRTKIKYIRYGISDEEWKIIKKEKWEEYKEWTTRASELYNEHYAQVQAGLITVVPVAKAKKRKIEEDEDEEF